jgi:hypothetical protein
MPLDDMVTLREALTQEISKVREDNANVVRTIAEHVTQLRVDVQAVVTRMADFGRLERGLEEEQRARQATDADLDKRLRLLEDQSHYTHGAQKVQSQNQGLWSNMWVRVGGTLLAMAAVAIASILFNAWANQQERDDLLRKIDQLQRQIDHPTQDEGQQ